MFITSTKYFIITFWHLHFIILKKTFDPEVYTFDNWLIMFKILNKQYYFTREWKIYVFQEILGSGYLAVKIQRMCVFSVSVNKDKVRVQYSHAKDPPTPAPCPRTEVRPWVLTCASDEANRHPMLHLAQLRMVVETCLLGQLGWHECQSQRNGQRELANHTTQSP